MKKTNLAMNTSVLCAALFLTSCAIPMARVPLSQDNKKNLGQVEEKIIDRQKKVGIHTTADPMKVSIIRTSAGILGEIMYGAAVYVQDKNLHKAIRPLQDMAQEHEFSKALRLALNHALNQSKTFAPLQNRNISICTDMDQTASSQNPSQLQASDKTYFIIPVDYEFSNTMDHLSIVAKPQITRKQGNKSQVLYENTIRYRYYLPAAALKFKDNLPQWKYNHAQVLHTAFLQIAKTLAQLIVEDLLIADNESILQGEKTHIEFPDIIIADAVLLKKTDKETVFRQADGSLLAYTGKLS